MSALLLSTVLACSMPMPLAEGEAPEDRRIAVANVPLPAAMDQSLRGPVPESSFRFVGESDIRREWIIAGQNLSTDGSRQMLRVTPREDFLSPYSVRLGSAVETEDGVYRFTLIAEGVCRLSADSGPTQERVQ